jgi:hypothetical protein
VFIHVIDLAASLQKIFILHKAATSKAGAFNTFIPHSDRFGRSFLSLQHCDIDKKICSAPQQVTRFAFLPHRILAPPFPLSDRRRIHLQQLPMQ